MVVFAAGNDVRGDDALGPLLLARIEGLAMATVRCVFDFQLQVEHALDLDGRTWRCSSMPMSPRLRRPGSAAAGCRAARRLQSRACAGRGAGGVRAAVRRRRPPSCSASAVWPSSSARV